MIKPTKKTKTTSETASFEFGGVVWHQKENGWIEVDVDGVGHFTISQYPDKTNEYSFGKWCWRVYFNKIDSGWKVLSGDNEPKVVQTDCWGVVDTKEEAMQRCLDAQQDFIQDIQRIAFVLGFDNYAMGLKDGVAAERDLSATQCASYRTPCEGCSPIKYKKEILDLVINQLIGNLNSATNP